MTLPTQENDRQDAVWRTEAPRRGWRIVAVTAALVVWSVGARAQEAPLVEAPERALALGFDASRRVFVRAEANALSRVAVYNGSPRAVSGATLRVTIAGRSSAHPLGVLAPGAAAMVEVAVDTRLRPGEIRADRQRRGNVGRGTGDSRHDPDPHHRTAAPAAPARGHVGGR